MPVGDILQSGGQWLERVVGCTVEIPVTIDHQTLGGVKVGQVEQEFQGAFGI